MNDSLTQINVLLADDHAVVRAGIRLFLEHAGDIQVVAEADDGEMAKTLLQHHRPDVAVLDIQMPKASGIEITRWIRSNLKNVGVLILTAYDDDPCVMAVLQAGANGYVLKTASPGEIIQAVRDVYAGKSAVNALIAQLGISDRTVQGHLAHIFGKLNATSRTEAVMRAVSLGWIPHTVGAVSEE